MMTPIPSNLAKILKGLGVNVEERSPREFWANSDDYNVDSNETIMHCESWYDGTDRCEVLYTRVHSATKLDVPPYVVQFATVEYRDEDGTVVHFGDVDEDELAWQRHLRNLKNAG